MNLLFTKCLFCALTAYSTKSSRFLFNCFKINSLGSLHELLSSSKESMQIQHPLLIYKNLVENTADVVGLGSCQEFISSEELCLHFLFVSWKTNIKFNILELYYKLYHQDSLLFYHNIQNIVSSSYSILISSPLLWYCQNSSN